MSEQKRRSRKTGQAQQVPQRVENAAQSMTASAGARRGYVPDAYATGRQQRQGAYAQGQQVPQGCYAPQQGYGAPQQQGYRAPQQQGYGAPQQQGYGAPQQRGYAPQQTGRQTYYADPRQSAQQSYYANVQRQMTGEQRGFSTAQTPPPASPKKKKGRTIAAVLAALVVVAGLGVGGYAAAKNYAHTKEVNDKVQPYDGLFCPGVYVDGISLGGMTPEQAMNSVQSQIRQRHDAWKVQLMYSGTQLAEINSDMLGFSVDPAQVMNEAWQQGHTGDSEERYEAMLQLEQTPYVAYTAKPDGNTGAIDEVLSQIKSQIDRPMTNAEMTAFDPSLSYPFVFTDEAYGWELDIEPVKERLYEMVSTLESGTVELEPKRIDPTVRKADLMKNYALRSSVYTPIDKHSTENRNNNIRKAFEKVNGYVLNPGKTCSFNGVVGERTEQNGFFSAIEYVYGEHVEGFGGGVCQASTTLYQAAVCAGLQIVKREPHSDSVSYTEYGKDATVYWVGKRKIDLSFKNTTDGPIYILAAVQEDPSNKKKLIARVTMYGQDLGDVRYELVAEVVETLPAPFEPEYVRDTNATYVVYTDQQESVSKAKEGYIVKSYRLTYSGNSLIESKDLYTDTYKPKAERIYVGVKSRD